MIVQNTRHFPRFLFFSFIVLTLCACEQAANERPLPNSYANNAEAGYALPVSGAHNFRDLGGYKTTDGLQVKWGKLFRSSRLSSLTDKDLEYLQLLNIQKIVDFRTNAEKQDKPDILPDKWSLQYLELPIDPGDNSFETIKRELEIASKNGRDLGGFMVNINRSLVEDFTPVYREWLKMLAEGDGKPLVFHCTAGKDRAGFAAAVLLLALDVPYETVMKDYLLSNVYSKAYIDRTALIFRAASFFQYDETAIRSLLSVRREYLQAAIDSIISKYGTLENYLEMGLGLDGVTRQKLKANYLIQ